MTTLEHEAEKHEDTHVELAKVDHSASDGLVKSRFDELSIPRTVWVFRRAVFYSLCVYTGYMMEGFEVRSTWPPTAFFNY